MIVILLDVLVGLEESARVNHVLLLADSEDECSMSTTHEDWEDLDTWLTSECDTSSTGSDKDLISKSWKAKIRCLWRVQWSIGSWMDAFGGERTHKYRSKSSVLNVTHRTEGSRVRCSRFFRLVYILCNNGGIEQEKNNLSVKFECFVNRS